jgi:hypothetical protein
VIYPRVPKFQLATVGGRTRCTGRRIPNGPYVYATSATAACVFLTAQADSGKAAANVPTFRTLSVSPLAGQAL